MMWNFAADISVHPEGYINPITKEDQGGKIKGYGGYHVFWQIMGFVFPFIGLLCFFIPICIVTTKEKGFDVTAENFFDNEEDDVHIEAQKKSEAVIMQQQEAAAATKAAAAAAN